jgi:hypothetical protein
MKNIEIYDELRGNSGNFNLVFRTRRNSNISEFIIQNINGGKHFASHTHFNLLNDYGKIIEVREINSEVAQFIINHFEKRGDTASFDIYESDLKSGNLLLRKPTKIDPSEIRHIKTDAEQTFTSTGSKLGYHWPIFQKLQETGYGSIIRATLTLHQVCSSHCHYCSTIARNKKDSISLEEAKVFVEKLYYDQAEYNRKYFKKYNDLYIKNCGSDIRLRGLILSGGGQPNLWPHFEEFVEWLSEMKIDIGLITNGFPKKVSDEVYTKFKWIRISITPEDASPHYIDGKFDLQHLPKSIINNSELTVGYSYVYGSWTTADILSRIKNSMDANGFEYCRLLTDCNLTRGAQLRAHESLAESLYNLNLVDKIGRPLDKFFHQLKYHGTKDEALDIWNDGQCQLQSYNVFWDTTGHDENGKSYCYACDSITVLSEEQDDISVDSSERKFNKDKWGTVTNDNVDQLYKTPLKSFFDPREVCTACLFMDNNRMVKELKNIEKNIGEVNNITSHVNFP